MRIPPTMAPGTELRPPRTTAGNTSNPRYPTEILMPLIFPKSAPPTPALINAMAQAAAYTNRALTPRERAAVSSSAVACMERPQRVYLKKHTKAMRRTMARINDHRYTGDILNRPTEMGLISKTGGVKTRVSDPQVYPMSPFKKKESPTVTMMTARMGSPMSLSKNIRSVRTPRKIPTSNVRSTDGIKGMPTE